MEPVLHFLGSDGALSTEVLPWVCPQCPAQKLSAPWLPGEWELASGMFFWSLSPQGERSLGWKPTGQVYPTQQGVRQPEAHSTRSHRTAGASSPQHDTCPGRMEVFLPHCTADIKQKSHCRAPFRLETAQSPQKYSLLPLLSTVAAKTSVYGKKRGSQNTISSCPKNVP